MPFDPEENARKMRQEAAAAAAKQRAASAGQLNKQKSNDKRRRWLKPTGIALLVTGAGLGANHWLTHVGVYGAQPPGWVDLAVGYPTAAALLILGGVAVGQR